MITAVLTVLAVILAVLLHVGTVALVLSAAILMIIIAIKLGRKVSGVAFNRARR